MVHHDFAHALWSTGRKEEALEQLREALNLNPAYSEARILLADSLFEMEQFGEAAENYVILLKIEPAPFYATHIHNQLGLALRALGHHEAAAEQFRQALDLAPDSGFYHFNLAVSLTTLGNRDEAVHHYQESLRIDPDNHRARLNLAERLVKWGDMKQASKQYNEIASRLPGTAEEHFSRGRIAEIDGDQTAALKEYQQGLLTKAVYPQVRVRLEDLIEELSQ